MLAGLCAAYFSRNTCTLTVDGRRSKAWISLEGTLIPLSSADILDYPVCFFQILSSCRLANNVDDPEH